VALQARARGAVFNRPKVGILGSNSICHTDALRRLILYVALWGWRRCDEPAPRPIKVRRTLIISELTAERDQTRPDQTRPDQTRSDQTKPDQIRPDQTRPDQTRQSYPQMLKNKTKEKTRTFFQMCGRKMNLTLGTQELSHACPLDRQAYNLSQESITCAEVPQSCWIVFRLAREIASVPFSSHLTVDWNLTALFAVRSCGA